MTGPLLLVKRSLTLPLASSVRRTALSWTENREWEENRGFPSEPRSHDRGHAIGIRTECDDSGIPLWRSHSRAMLEVPRPSHGLTTVVASRDSR